MLPLRSVQEHALRSTLEGLKGLEGANARCLFEVETRGDEGTRIQHFTGNRLRDGNRLHRLGALTEAVLEAARHVAHVAKAARTSGASPLRFLRPVVGALPGTRVSARSAPLLLNMVRPTAAPHAERVRLARALSITRGTFRLRVRKEGKCHKAGATLSRMRGAVSIGPQFKMRQ